MDLAVVNLRKELRFESHLPIHPREIPKYWVAANAVLTSASAFIDLRAAADATRRSVDARRPTLPEDFVADQATITYGRISNREIALHYALAEETLNFANALRKYLREFINMHDHFQSRWGEAGAPGSALELFRAWLGGVFQLVLQIQAALEPAVELLHGRLCAGEEHIASATAPLTSRAVLGVPALEAPAMAALALGAPGNPETQ